MSLAHLLTPEERQALNEMCTRLAVCGLLMASGSTAHATCKDNYQFAPDKQKHFVGSIAMASAATAATKSGWAGFAISTAIGGAYEIADSKRDKCGSWQDFAYDLIGSALGASGTHILIGPRFIGWRQEF